MPRTVRLLWEGQAGGFGDSARTFRFDAFVPDPIASIDPAYALSAVEAIVEADRAVIALGTMPGLAGLEALSRQLLRAESVASSWIEGLRLSQRRLARAILDPAAADRTTRGVVGNILAMERAIQLGASTGAITTADLLELHRILFEGTDDERFGGRIREGQNWVGGSSVSPRRAEFIPPPASDVPPLLDDLCAFVARTDLPSVAQAAIAHAQFETIHPFLDGNGRVGRLLITLLLCDYRMLGEPLLYLSLFFKQHRDEYYRLLDLARLEGDWEAWLTFFLEGVAQTADGALGTARDLTRLFDEDRQRIQATGRKAGSSLRVHEALKARPLLTLTEAVARSGLSFPAASAGMDKLAELGIASELTGKKRNRIFAYDRYLAVLTAGT